MHPRRWIFDHLPKTAGTSVFAALRNCLGDAAVRQAPNGTLAEDAEAAANGGVTVVGGHLDFRPGHLVPPGFGYFSFLRDPVETVLSTYYYYRNVDLSAPGTAVAYAKRVSLDEFIECDWPQVRAVTCNVFTRHFAAPIIGATDVFSSALRRLDDYAYVGLAEAFEDSFLLLASLMGRSAPIEMPRLNVTQRPSDAVARSVRLSLERLNELDLMLYAHVRERHLAAIRGALRVAATASSARHTARPTSASDRRNTLTSARTDANLQPLPPWGTGEIKITEVELLHEGQHSDKFVSGDEAVIRIRLHSSISTGGVSVGIGLYRSDARAVFGTNLALLQGELDVKAGADYFCEFKVVLLLAPADYRLSVAVHLGSEHVERCFEWCDGAGYFTISGFREVPFAGLVGLPCSVVAGPMDVHSPLAEYRGRIELLHRDSPPRNFLIAIWNDGREPWPHRGFNPVRVGCRWFDSTMTLVPIEGPRSEFSTGVGPGERVTAQIDAGTPPPSAAFCRLTLVHEGVTWFDDRAGPFLDVGLSEWRRDKS